MAQTLALATVTVVRSLTVAAVLATIVLHSGVESIQPSDHPNLTILKSFTSANGEKTNIIERIGIHYEDFGICILKDDHGTKVSNIRQSRHYQVNSIVTEIVRDWLKGRGKRPETWAVFVDCLRVVQLNVLADIIEEQYGKILESEEESTHTVEEQDQEEEEVEAKVTPTTTLPTVSSTTPEIKQSVQKLPDEPKHTPTSPPSTSATTQVKREEKDRNVQISSSSSTQLSAYDTLEMLDGHPIKKFHNFKYAFLPVGCDEWEELCMVLDVDRATINDLRRRSSDCDKMNFCVQEFFETGKATWERVMYVLASQPLNYVVPAKEIGRKYDIDYYTLMGAERPFHPQEPSHHTIKKFEDLNYALLSLSYDDWEDLCRLLGVGEATVTDLKRWKGNIERWSFCLHDYLRYGTATWEHVMQVVAGSPFNQVVTAKTIGKKYDIDYYDALGLVKPVYPDQSNHHKIKKFTDLKYAVTSVPYEDWEDFCTLLNVNKATLTDLKRWSDNIKKWEFCLEEYFRHGVSTWEDVMRAVASSPFNHIVTAKEIARKYGIDYYASMELQRPMYSLNPDEHKIKKLTRLQNAVMNIPYTDWEILCKQLNVGDATVTDLKRWGDNIQKWNFCLQDYFDTGGATWEHVIYAVASEPLNQIVMAKKIARDYGINYQAVMNERRQRDEL